MKKINKKLSVWQVLAIGYLVIILLGSLLLKLPIATRDGEQTTFINALFTSTSATCVTGLVPYDTNLHWSIFGQLVILFLIQIGGLGFMTFISVAFFALKKHLGIYQSKLLMESAGEFKFNNLSNLIKRILLGTLIFELIGTGLLSIRFIPDFGAKGLYIALWHSISAFCNAGFDIMGNATNGGFVSLAQYAFDPLVVLTIGLLILIGGLGFFIWSDCLNSKFKYSKMQLHTKIVLLANLIVIICSIAMFYFFERNNPLLTGRSVSDKFLVAFFSTTTPRTAGFSTLPLTSLSESSYTWSIVLMFIGGSSGSTAGGVKINTIAIIVISSVAVFRHKQDVNAFNKRIPDNLIKKALAIFCTYISLIIISTLLILSFDKITFKNALFEVVSAICTVGLSLSVTPTLTVASKIVLILLMYVGRVGVLTFIHAFADKNDNNEIRKPIGNLMVG